MGLKDIYLRKDDERNNTYLELLRVTDDVLVFKEIDTITGESDIFGLSYDEACDNLYNASSLLKKHNKVNKIGYYEEMLDFDKEIYKTYVLLYKDKYNELLYDMLSNILIISPSVFELNNFVSLHNDVKIFRTRKR